MVPLTCGIFFYISFMNYLGHLYFSGDDLELMYANLYGDHFKGSDFHDLPEIIVRGVKLHRSIDNYIDHHPLVVKLMKTIYPELPKVTGIAIDLFFDHLLAKNWDKFHPLSLNTFLSKFYEYEAISMPYFSDEFKSLISQMKMSRWLNYYPDFEGLKKACQGVSSRLSFPNKLGQATDVYLKHETDIDACFYAYMSDANGKFLSKNPQ